MKSGSAVLADAVERELVRGHFKSFVGELGRLEIFLSIDHDIEHAVAALADEMLMARQISSSCLVFLERLRNFAIANPLNPPLEISVDPRLTPRWRDNWRDRSPTQRARRR